MLLRKKVFFLGYSINLPKHATELQSTKYVETICIICNNISAMYISWTDQQ